MKTKFIKVVVSERLPEKSDFYFVINDGIEKMMKYSRLRNQWGSSNGEWTTQPEYWLEEVLEKPKELKKEIKKYVDDWMSGHEPDTFIKNENGVYMYSAGAVSLNLKVFFENLLEDFINDKLETED